MEYIYPAIFHENDDGSLTITYPDLPGCVSEGKNLGNAMIMAQAALSEWIEYLNDNKQELPSPSHIKDIKPLAASSRALSELTLRTDAL
ncbi:MAG: type II toxin-antitoxin system HicB family antitoxin [Clostridiales bacterium]|jgi:predicted RNase H-like HicB family nuclease|nr:type II toxin-antitoxin system HicB family antitoxin [Clostridiales bacterium]